MITKLLAIFLTAILSLGLITIPTNTNTNTNTNAFASSNGDNGNGNGNGDEQTEQHEVDVTVQRGENDSEHYLVTQNLTLVVTFDETLATNETVTVGEIPEVGAGAGGSSNETAPPVIIINETRPADNATAPPVGNETAPPAQNVTEPQPIPCPELPPNAVQNGSTVCPNPPMPVPPIVVIPPGNDTSSPTLPNGTIPVDNGTSVPPTEPEPQAKPNAINLALIESIQRGHTQHITAFVTDDRGNEFNDENVMIKVVNAKGKILQNVQVTSGQDFAFKVGPRTNAQAINVFATLQSDPNIGTQADYDVFPKAKPMPPQVPPQIELPIELPPILNQSGVSSNATGNETQ